jgi:predicted permease
MTGPGDRLFAWLIRLYPREFRRQYADDLLAFFRQDRAHPKYGTGRLRPVRFWIATLRDSIRAAWAQRRASAAPASLTTRPARGAAGRLGHDLRDGWHSLWAAPGVTLAALAVLTLGIGAGTAIFSVVDAVVLRGLPFDEDHRLVRVSETDLKSGRPVSVAPQNYLDWFASPDVFEHTGATAGSIPFVTADEPVESLRVWRVTASLFDVLRVQPVRGRSFLPSDEQPGAPAVAVISDALWRRRFGGDPSIVGRTFASRSREVRIVGIMPPGFSYPVSVTGAGTVDAWVPFTWTDAMRVRGNARNYLFSVLARLQPGVSVDDASARMALRRASTAARYPAWFEDRGVVVMRLQDAIVGASVRSWMFLLLNAVAVLVLMACLNAAHLLVARAVTRAPEMAVRAALGASRWDLARGLLVQSLVVSLLGAAGGVLVALWGVEILRTTLPGNVPRLADVVVDLRVLGIATAAAIASGALFGTIPAMHASRPDVITLLGQAGRSQSGGPTTRRIRGGLVIAEVALAVVLLSGAALFLASYRRVTTVDLGFDPTHVVSVLDAVMGTTFLVPAETADEQARARTGQAVGADLVARIGAIPGVIAVTPMQGGTPLSGNRVTVPLQHPDGRTFAGDDEPNVRSVGPEYLDVLRAALIRGRWIAATDRSGADSIVVLSQEAARRYFGSADPIGARVRMNGYGRTVVGVVQSIRWGGPESDIDPEVFIPFAQTSHPSAQVLVRTASDPGSLIPAFEAAVRSAAPGTTTVGVVKLEERYAALIAQRKFNMIVLAIFGTVAVAIAAVGVYALMAFTVAQRRRELGVRMALGAVPRFIVSLVLGGALRLLFAGLVPGLAAALLLEQWAQAFLFNAPTPDVALYAGVAFVLVTAGVIAAVGPARRATRVDPLVALRAE